MNPNAITDIYLYDIPIAERHNLCKILLIQNVWEILAEQMGYDSIEVNELKSIKYETKYKEAEELLARWGEQNHTITELFVLLSRLNWLVNFVTIIENENEILGCNNMPPWMQ